MAKTRSESKKITKEEKPEEVVVVEENLQVQSSGSESASDNESESDSEIEGLSEAEEGEGHNIKQLKQKKHDASQDKKSKVDVYSNIVYISRLPHGFNEKELSKYFSQFGDLKEVRLARNKKSGNSRHYGFIEFANKDDAKVAQETMNNYLLMGHLLQVRLMGKGSKIEKLYKYKKRVFIEPTVKKSVAELKKQSKTKQQERMNKLAEAGIDFKW